MGPSATPSELLLSLLAHCCDDSPSPHALITPHVRCTGHKKMPTSAVRTKAWPDSLNPDPSHFTVIVCLSGFDQPWPNLSTLWLSLSSLSVLCVPTIQSLVFVRRLPPMPTSVDIDFGVKCCATRRPITAFFHRGVGRQCEGGDKMEEKEANSWSSQQPWRRLAVCRCYGDIHWWQPGDTHLHMLRLG